MSVAKTVVYTLVVPVPLTVVLPWWLLRCDPLDPRWDAGPWRWLGVVPIAAGAALYLWCAWEFATAGRGTPNPADPPRALVARGPYAWSRNPMYVACLAMMGGETWLFASTWLLRYALGSMAVVWCLVRLYEEPRLRRVFAEAYAAYTARVPRWIGPRR